MPRTLPTKHYVWLFDIYVLLNILFAPYVPLTLFISSPASSSSWLKVKWLWNHMHRRIQSTCFKPLASGGASVVCFWQALGAAWGWAALSHLEVLMCPMQLMPTWLARVRSLCPETLQNGAQGSCALPPPGPSCRWTCTFNLMLFFLLSADTHTQNYYYLLVTACCWFIRRGKCICLNTLPVI